MQTLKFLFLAICLSATLDPLAALAKARKFAMASGQTIEAEVVDVKSGYVTLRMDGKEFGRSLKEFSPDARRYFRAWLRIQRGQFDWPSERGYGSNGTTEESLSPGEPTVLWKAEAGAGHAVVVVDGQAAYTTGMRGGEFASVALRLTSGREIWKKSHKVKTGTAGEAVASPVIDAETGLLCTLGPGGRIDARKLGDGQNVWANELQVKFPDATLPVGGVFGSPVIGSHLYVEIGGASYSLVGLAPSNGVQAWHIGKHRSLGVTPVIAQIGPRKLVVSRNDYGLVARRVETGTMAWDQVWQGKGRASPVQVGDDHVFVSADKECAMFRVDGDRTVEVWSNSSLCHPFSTPIYHDGFLYGFNGGALCCIDIESGEATWSNKDFGDGNLILAGDQLLIVTRRSGEFVVVAADPKKFTELSRTKVFDGESRTIPVLASGKVFCRNAAGQVTCLEMREKE